MAYVVSYGVVAAYWIQHSSIFHYVKFGNRTLAWLNILFLLPLTLLPFLTNLRVSYHGEYITTLLYAGDNIFGGAAMLALWGYGYRQGLLRTRDPVVNRSMRRRIQLGLALNLVGAAVAPIHTLFSSLCFLMLPVIYFSHRVVDSHWNTAGDGQNAAQD